MIIQNVKRVENYRKVHTYIIKVPETEAGTLG